MTFHKMTISNFMFSSARLKVNSHMQESVRNFFDFETKNGKAQYIKMLKRIMRQLNESANQSSSPCSMLAFDRREEDEVVEK